MDEVTQNNLEFTGLVLGISAVAGFLGSLTGLGGGVIITPALALLLGVDLRYAIGASLVSVIATSSGAAAAYDDLQRIHGEALRRTRAINRSKTSSATCSARA
jgi:uncharacterized membrane protein YfcA